jgi:hypothetical protein
MVLLIALLVITLSSKKNFRRTNTLAIYAKTSATKIYKGSFTLAKFAVKMPTKATVAILALASLGDMTQTGLF